MAKRMLLMMKLLPEGTDVDLEKLKEQVVEYLPEGFELQKNTFSTQELAFGLKALKFRCFSPNEEGVTDVIEEALAKIPGIQRAEVELMSLTDL
ncbi:MAG: elongation factor 1-beta [Candidatus Helarchaeales archaeon]